MEICDPKGRDCIEKNSFQTFHCEKTCVGVYADVQWVRKAIEGELKDEEIDEAIKADLEATPDNDLLKRFLLIEKELKLVKNDMKAIATGNRGEELDREKYKMLISEYRKFKTKNMQHFRFTSATSANLSTFG